MNNYIEHHGIKGMHWGVRRYQNPDGSLTAAGRKRYGYREQDIKRFKSSNEASRRSISKNQSDLDDLNKNGTNSKIFKKAYGDFDDKTFEEMYGATKKEALVDMKNETRKDIDYSVRNIKDNERIINNIQSTPIYEKSYTEKMESGRKAAQAILVGGTILSTSLSIAASQKSYITGKTAVKLALAGSLGSLAASTNVYAANMTKTNREIQNTSSKKSNP